MRRVSKIALAAIVSVGLAVGLPILVAASAPADITKTPPPPPPTLVVDDDGAGTASNCNAETATYKTIQAAVNAAPSGATVKVCPGTYNESVLVDHTLAILGAQAGVDARTRNVPLSSESVVNGTPGFVIAANGVTVDGFTVTGSNASGVDLTPDHSGYRILNNIVRDNSFGIYANSNGNSQSTISQNSIHDNNGFSECQRCDAAPSEKGVGIFEDQGTRNIVIQTNFIGNEDVAGILLFFVPGAPPKQGAFGVTIQTNAISNTGVNFIALFDATNTTISGNTLSNSSVGEGGGPGILVGAPSSNTQIYNNVITHAHDSGIFVRDIDAFGNSQPAGVTGVIIQGNTVTGAGDQGIDADAASPGAVRTTGNTAKTNGEGGIRYGSSTNANTISGNIAQNNGFGTVETYFDCQDLSHGSGTSGTANTWSSNNGNTSSPPGLCKPPATKGTTSTTSPP